MKTEAASATKVSRVPAAASNEEEAVHQNWNPQGAMCFYIRLLTSVGKYRYIHMLASVGKYRYTRLLTSVGKYRYIRLLTSVGKYSERNEIWWYS